jgi:isopenicillin N synthase-like dioxygenase
VPIIDVSAPEQDAATRVRAACIDSGFFYVSHHGVPEELVAAAFDANRRLFALPVGEKLKLLADKNYRGYTPMAEETLDPGNQTRGDTKEGWYMGR